MVKLCPQSQSCKATPGKACGLGLPQNCLRKNLEEVIAKKKQKSLRLVNVT